MMLHLPIGIAEHFNESPQSERIEMMKIWKMTEVLNLSENQAQKFFPRYNTMIKEIEELAKQQKDVLEKLRETLESEQTIKENDIDVATKKVMDLEKQKLNKKQKFVEDLGDIVSPVQKARYVVLQMQFKDELRRRIREHRPSQFQKGERPRKKQKM